ncbi:MAG: TatD family hydrolase [Candidatus Omnitrophica bacterium]|nr:TatD family hydrolase [Candidatus Omnitrophota bacterium]
MFDSHCHLNLPPLNENLDLFLGRARNAGVKDMVVVGIDLESSRSAIELVSRAEGLRATVGLHPHEAKSCDESLMHELRALAQDPGVCAIGEIGLDYYRCLSPVEDQIRVFKAFLDLATELHLPVVVHCRDAQKDMVRLLREREPLAFEGVMHCFSGDLEYLQAVLDLGFYVSFAGNLTYPKAGELRAAAALVPADRILSETDSPYLSPQTCRGQTNEPAHVLEVIECLAQVRGAELQVMAEQTWGNAVRLFGRTAL